MSDDELYDGYTRQKPWFMKVNWSAVLVLAVVVLAVGSMSFRYLFTPHELARVQGQIVRIEMNKMYVNVYNITWLADNVIEFNVDNPVEVTSGMCFNDYLIDLCPVGTYVELVNYRNGIDFLWWHQEAIIYGLS